MTFKHATLTGLDLATDRRRIVENVLGTIPAVDAAAWVDKLQVRDKRIAGTYYADLASILSFNDFVTLYTAIGYDMTLANFNSICADPSNISPHCVLSPGNTCDPLSCHI